MLLKIILQGTVDGRRRKGRPHKSRKDNIEEWTGQSMSQTTEANGHYWAVITVEASVGVPQ